MVSDRFGATPVHCPVWPKTLSSLHSCVARMPICMDPEGGCTRRDEGHVVDAIQWPPLQAQQGTCFVACVS